MVWFSIDWHVDSSATVRIRDNFVPPPDDRTARAHSKANVEGARQVTEGLFWSASAASLLACAKCHTRISSAHDNYKLHCVNEAHPVTAANPHVLDPKIYIDDAVVYRLHLPGLLVFCSRLRSCGKRTNHSGNCNCTWGNAR